MCRKKECEEAPVARISRSRSHNVFLEQRLMHTCFDLNCQEVWSCIYLFGWLWELNGGGTIENGCKFGPVREVWGRNKREIGNQLNNLSRGNNVEQKPM